VGLNLPIQSLDCLKHRFTLFHKLSSLIFSLIIIEAIAYRQANAKKHENGHERMIVNPSFYHKIATDILNKGFE